MAKYRRSKTDTRLFMDIPKIKGKPMLKEVFIKDNGGDINEVLG